MALFRRQFQVLRIVIAAMKDDQVLVAAGDIKLSVSNKSQVAGPHKGTFIGIGDPGFENRIRDSGLTTASSTLAAWCPQPTISRTPSRASSVSITRLLSSSRARTLQTTVRFSLWVWETISVASA